MACSEAERAFRDLLVRSCGLYSSGVGLLEIVVEIAMQNDISPTDQVDHGSWPRNSSWRVEERSFGPPDPHLQDADGAIGFRRCRHNRRGSVGKSADYPSTHPQQELLHLALLPRENQQTKLKYLSHHQEK